MSLTTFCQYVCSSIAVFIDPASPATLASGVPVELDMDAPRHRPFTDADAEIIDRMPATSSVVQLAVCVVTGDGGMDLAAKIEGLKVIGL